MAPRNRALDPRGLESPGPIFQTLILSLVSFPQTVHRPLPIPTCCSGWSSPLTLEHFHHLREKPTGNHFDSTHGHHHLVVYWHHHSQYWNQIDYLLCSWRWRSSIQSAKIRPGADCGSDRELPVAKFRLKLKTNGLGKTTKPLRYDLNQIPYDYTMEVTNRFKRLDLLDRVAEEFMDRGS